MDISEPRFDELLRSAIKQIWPTGTPLPLDGTLQIRAFGARECKLGGHLNVRHIAGILVRGWALPRRRGIEGDLLSVVKPSAAEVIL